MAYSVDLRKRVVAGVLEQGLSTSETAKVFQVGTATVERYLKQFRGGGELTPGPPQVVIAALTPRKNNV